MSYPNGEDGNNGEVFFGKITRSELLHGYAQFDKVLNKDKNNEKKQNSESDIPEVPEQNTTILPANSITLEKSDMLTSFKIDKIVSELDESCKNNDLDNTLAGKDIIFIKSNIESEINHTQEMNIEECETATDLLSLTAEFKQVAVNNVSDQYNLNPPSCPTSQYSTPIKGDKSEVFSTPCNKPLEKSTLFKTPAQPVSSKKSLCAKKTPVKSSYQHIASPIAAYIKNGSQIPLIRNVLPKKPLPGCSSIPKLVKPKSVINKENINVPPLVIKSTKTTKIMNVSEKEKIPQGHWVKKTTSSLPKRMIPKHDHSKINAYREALQSNQEDSLSDLSLQHGDVTQ